ncbi:MAG: ABC transporter ATP-binding protein [Candidatus Hodarchaeales archaeon]|jgi:ABC-2 type transport system ATP-binding protein
MSKDSTTLIQYQDVSKNFGTFRALDQISFEIMKGEILGFLGPNGAGKSTTMKLLAGLLDPTAGQILIHTSDGVKVLTRKNRDLLLSDVGFLIENPIFYDMTPRKLLTYFARLKGYPRHLIESRIEEIMESFLLLSWIDTKINKFSKGMRQKLGILSAVVHDPGIIVLDEPQSGLDPAARKFVRNFLLLQKAEGKTIFISSHLLYEIAEVADRVIIISEGNIIACDTIENLDSQIRHSVIRLEVLYHSKDDLNHINEKIKRLVLPLTGLVTTASSVYYNKEFQRFEILFDGDQTKQNLILKSLVDNEIKVIQYSVPKTNLLENLYLRLVEENQENTNNQTNFIPPKQIARA